MKITTGIKKAPLTLLVYGREGIGKSTFASHAKNPIFLKFEDRLDHIDTSKSDLITSIDQMDKNLIYLKTQDHGFNTVVVDTITAMQALAVKHVLDKYNAKSLSEGDHGKFYVDVQQTCFDFVDSLFELRQSKNMNIVFVGHALIKPFAPPIGEPYDRYQLDLMDKVANKVIQAVDCVLFVEQEVETIVNKAKKNQATSTGKRVMRTEPSPSYIAKNSYNLPKKIEFSWAAFTKEVLKFYETKTTGEK